MRCYRVPATYLPFAMERLRHLEDTVRLDRSHRRTSTDARAVAPVPDHLVDRTAPSKDVWIVIVEASPETDAIPIADFGEHLHAFASHAHS